MSASEALNVKINFQLKEKPFMSKLDNTQPNNQQSAIEDLPVESVAQQDVKGGPRGTVERNDSVQILLNTTY
jgi:hypothetical protein